MSADEQHALEPDAGRVDVHRHLMLDRYVQLRADNDVAARAWTPRMNVDAAIADMDDAGIATSVVSVPTPPSPIGRDGAEMRRFCRDNNDYLADVTRTHPDRFGMFACIPLPDVDAALEEIEYAFGTLGADGIHVFTNYGELWMADPSFAPVYAELDRRGAVLYTHPRTPSCCAHVLPELGVSDAIIEYGTDTTRALMQYVFGGTASRCPSIQPIFSHAGGTMPMLVERFVNLAATKAFTAVCPDGFLPLASRFYYDTAQASNTAAMSALRAVAPASQVLFGTDFPWRTAREHADALRACGVFDARDIDAIERRNPAALLPRVASMARRVGL